MSETQQTPVSYFKLRDDLHNIAQAEGGPMFMGWPDRWWEAHTRRCTNGHVSTRVLKSEALGRDACLAAGCGAPLILTFPEDVDGPLVAPGAPKPVCSLCHGSGKAYPEHLNGSIVALDTVPGYDPRVPCRCTQVTP